MYVCGGVCGGMCVVVCVMVCVCMCVVKAGRNANPGNATIGSYHSLPSLWSKYKTYETPATPNVLGIYLLGKIAEDMNRKGIEAMIGANLHSLLF